MRALIFQLRLSNAGNAFLARAQGAATITDNDPVPVLSIASGNVTEGDAGSAGLNLTVRLSTASGQTVSASSTMAAGSAAPDSDYTAVTGTISFPASPTTQTISVPVLGGSSGMFP